MNNIYYDEWVESEQGWGIRPDGISLHKNQADYKIFVKKYWDRQPAAIPEEYSLPSDNLRLGVASDSLLEEILQSENGVRLYPHGVRKLIEEGDLEIA